MTAGTKSSSGCGVGDSARKTGVVRAFSSHKPKWQRFQSSVAAPPPPVSNNKKNNPTQQQQQHPYQRQYSHVYHHRLAALKERCWQSVDDSQKKQKSSSRGSSSSSSNEIPRVDRVLDLSDTVNQECVVVGTLIKEGSSGNNKEDPLHPDSKCRASDALFLEDESGRIGLRMTGACGTVHGYCTGIVIAVQGMVPADSNGVMEVTDVFYPKLLLSSNNDVFTASTTTTASEPEPHLLLLSGLHCGDPNISTLPRQMLLSYLQGRFGTDPSHPSASCARVSRVIIAGESCKNTTTTDTAATKNNSSNGTATNNGAHSSSTNDLLTGIKEMDTFCLQLLACCGIPIDILPGKNDPTTANWPQRPLHSSLLKASSLFSNHVHNGSTGSQQLLSRSPNPYAAYHGCDDSNVNSHSATNYVLGTDGANITDLTKSILRPATTTKESNTGGKGNGDDHETNKKEGGTEDTDKKYEPITELEALKLTLKNYCHICPNGPDSIPTMPHFQHDPMIIGSDDKNNTIPKIYFAGNCSEFATELISLDNANTDTTNINNNSCRLICIPQFSKTSEAALVNLRTLDVELLRFEIDDATN